jgi:hypothetical protein
MATGGAVGSGQSLAALGDIQLETSDDIETYLKHFELLPFFDKSFEK